MNAKAQTKPTQRLQELIVWAQLNWKHLILVGIVTLLSARALWWLLSQNLLVLFGTQETLETTGAAFIIGLLIPTIRRLQQ